MKLLKLSTVVLAAGLAVGCATNSDIENLQGQINTLKTDVSSAKSAANSATSISIFICFSFCIQYFISFQDS